VGRSLRHAANAAANPAVVVGGVEVAESGDAAGEAPPRRRNPSGCVASPAGTPCASRQLTNLAREAAKAALRGLVVVVLAADEPDRDDPPQAVTRAARAINPDNVTSRGRRPGATGKRGLTAANPHARW
jgi:hypothetical protein